MKHNPFIIVFLLLLFLTFGLIILIPPTVTSKPASPTTSKPQTVIHIRGMFYYPWFPETWVQDGIRPFTHYHPSLGFYNSSESAVIAQQIKAMQYAGMQVGIFEWNGQGTLLDSKIPLLLRAASGTGFKWAAYYDQEGLNIGFGPDPTPKQIANDLTYINTHYGNDPSYMRINGKPLVFVYADIYDRCGMADRWREANKITRDYIVLKVFPGYKQCISQPDGWHQYDPAIPEDNQKSNSFTVSPGFWKADQTDPLLARDPKRFEKNVQDMVTSNAPFQLVTSFNEWGEGSAVESAKEWKSESGYGVYLDILHNKLVKTQ